MNDLKTFFLEKLKRILALDTEGITIYLDLGNRIEKANIQHDFESILASDFKSELGKILSRVNDEEMSIVNYSTSDNRSEVIYHWDLECDSPINHIFTRAENNDCYFTLEHINNIKGIIGVYGTQECNIRTYRRFFSINLFKKERKICMINNNLLVPIKKNMLQIDCKIDWLCFWNENKWEEFIIEPKAVEKDETFKQKLKTQALTSLGVIHRFGFVANIMDLNSLTDNPTYAKKIIAISENNELVDVTPLQLKTHIQSIPKTSNSFTFDNANHPNLSSMSQKKLFLDILNDDIFRSDLTRITYRNQSKDRFK